MDKFQTTIGGKRERDITTDQATGADHAAALVLYYARNEADFDLDTQISVQACRDDGGGWVSTLRPDLVTVKDILEWIRGSAGRYPRSGEPEDFYTAMEALADEMLPAED